MNGAELITAVLDDGGFDVPRLKALEWLNQRQRRMVVEADWSRSEVQIGTTVAGQAGYPIGADMMDLSVLTVVDGAGGETWYDRTGERTIRRLKSGDVFWGGKPAFAPLFGSDRTPEVQLYPVPDTSGYQIMGLTSAEPPDIQDSTVAGVGPVIPSDLHQYLRDGAIATGYALIEERADSAGYFEQQFTTGVELLRRRQNSRVGSGPVQMAVKGWTA